MMKAVTMLRSVINENALHEELLAELGIDYIGLSTTPKEIMIHLADDAASDAVLLAQIIVKSHDPQRLTEKQLLEREREQEIARLESEFPSVLDSNQFSGESSLILELAERLRRLELLMEAQNAR